MKRAPAHRDAGSTGANVASRRTIRTLVSTCGSCDATFVGWMPFSGGPLRCLRVDVCGRWLIFGRGIVDTYLAALTHPTTGLVNFPEIVPTLAKRTSWRCCARPRGQIDD